MSRSLGRRGDWLASAPIGVVALTRFNPRTGKTQRIGTEQFYFKDYPGCLSVAGFQMKPAFKQWLRERQAQRSGETR